MTLYMKSILCLIKLWLINISQCSLLSSKCVIDALWFIGVQNDKVLPSIHLTLEKEYPCTRSALIVPAGTPCTTRLLVALIRFLGSLPMAQVN